MLGLLRLLVVRLVVRFVVYEIYISKELSKVEVLLLDVTRLQLIDVVYDPAEVRLMMRLEIRHEVCLFVTSHQVCAPYISMVFHRKVKRISALFPYFT